MLFLLPEYKLSNVIEYFSNETDVDNNISNFKMLLQDMFKSYIFNYCLEIRYDFKFFCDIKPNESKILSIKILNHSDTVIKDATLNLGIKPIKRMELNVIKNPNNENLDKKLEWKYELTGKMAGKVNFSIQLAMKDPFIENNILNYEKKLGFITIIEKL